MSNSKDKRTEYERYNKKSEDAGINSMQSSPEHNKIADIANSSSPAQTAAYLADMLHEMQNMAEQSGHRSLVEMLEFAHREAVWRSKERPGHPDEGEQIR